MDIIKFDDILSLNPFKHMSKTKINNVDNCILANRSFVKFDNIRYIPLNSLHVNSLIDIRGYKYTLLELLYSPFILQQYNYQYLLPSFVLNCINKAIKNKKVCKYYVKDLGDDNGINITIFIPTINSNKYIIIGLKLKDFWSIKFKID
ncbi:hypothetical protein [Brazilian porcupinepox virus 1]|nr:hypothetical protein [Brazilian porcupinepox virus 1]